MNTELKDLIRTLSPVLYLSAHVTVLVLTGLVVQSVEQHWVLHGLFRKGDLDAAVACLITGALVFPVATLMLAKQDGFRQSWLAGHLRQSAGVYALLLATVAYLISAHSEQRDGLGYGVAAGAFMVGLYAVVLNALVLWLLDRRTSTLRT